MERVVTAKEMQWCDETTIKGIGVPGLLLMENAGKAVLGVMRTVLGDLAGKRVVILCGKGNNGGDGYVLARHLTNTGAQIFMFLTSTPAELKGDAFTNFTLLKKIAARSEPPVTIQRYSKQAIETLGRIDCIVDAMFGTGFAGSLKHPVLGLIEWVNAQRVPVFAVDIPSGLNATTGVVENGAIRASHTVTFGLRKTGLLLNQGKEYCGEIHVADIGIPKFVSEAKTLSKTFLVGGADVQRVLPRRSNTAHKYSVGKVLVIAGSKGLTGAASLCATSALRTGAGAVLLCVPESVYPTMARKLTEVMVMPLPATEEGTIGEKAYDVLAPKLKWADVVAIGPGLSQNRETRSVVLSILKEHPGRLLIDADGLNAVATEGMSVLKKFRGEAILTPHAGEFARLNEKKSEEVERDRIEMPRSLARNVHATVVLKGAPTVTVAPDGTVIVNSTGNPGMATIGSGDVLSGMIASLWAQGCPTEAAAWAGVFLHGLAGDRAKEALGERSIVAGDLITFLPKALLSVERETIA